MSPVANAEHQHAVIRNPFSFLHAAAPYLIRMSSVYSGYLQLDANYYLRQGAYVMPFVCFSVCLFLCLLGTLRKVLNGSS